MYTFDIVGSRLGNKIEQVDPESGTWSRLLCAGGKGEHVFALADDDVMWDKSLSRQWATTLVVSWNGVAVYGGIIIDRIFDDVAGTLTIIHEDFRSILQRRYPFGVNSYWQPDTGETQAGTLTLTNLSQRAIVIRLLEEALTGNFDIYSMSVIMPAFRAEAGPFTRTYENSEMLTADAAISNVQDEDGGPDVDFEPLWVAERFWWNVRIGSPTAPRLSAFDPTGVPFDFNMTADELPLTGMKVREFGRSQATGVFAVGAGSGRNMKVAGHGLGTSAAIPALDVVETYKEEIDINRLFLYAYGALPARGAATRQYEFGMLTTEEPGLDLLRMGSIFRLLWSGHRWVDDGESKQRLISMSGNMTENLTIDVQDWSG